MQQQRQAYIEIAEEAELNAVWASDPNLCEFWKARAMAYRALAAKLEGPQVTKFIPLYRRSA
jgi:hypothetical protein